MSSFRIIVDVIGLRRQFGCIFLSDKDISIIRITGGTGPKKGHIFLLGGQHAREWISHSTVTCTYSLFLSVILFTHTCRHAVQTIKRVWHKLCCHFFGKFL